MKEAGIMRIILKILLFPISLALAILIMACRFLCSFSSVILGILSFGLFVLAVCCVIFLWDMRGALTAIIFSFLISPFGIPKFAEWLIDRMEDLHYAIKSI